MIHLFNFFILVFLYSDEKSNIAKTGTKKTFSQRYNLIAITTLQHYNFISLYSTCDKLCLSANFQKDLISWNIHKTILTFCFTYFLHSWEFTLRVTVTFPLKCWSVLSKMLYYGNMNSTLLITQNIQKHSKH